MNLREWAAVPRSGLNPVTEGLPKATFRLATFEESNAGWEKFFLDADITPPGTPVYLEGDGFVLEFKCDSEKFYIRQSRGVGTSIRIGILEMRSEYSKNWFEILDRHHMHSVFELIRVDLQGWLDAIK